LTSHRIRKNSQEIAKTLHREKSEEPFRRATEEDPSPGGTEVFMCREPFKIILLYFSINKTDFQHHLRPGVLRIMCGEKILNKKGQTNHYCIHQ